MQQCIHIFTCSTFSLLILLRFADTVPVTLAYRHKATTRKEQIEEEDKKSLPQLPATGPSLPSMLRSADTV